MEERNHENQFVRMAIKHFDRPTDLKREMRLVKNDFEVFVSEVKIAIQVYSQHPLIQNDLRLACLRCICADDAKLYVDLLDLFPEIVNDKRAVQSIEFYKNKTLDLL